jgi:intracellular septation protein
MQFLADYFPLLLFFVAFKWQGIFAATATAIVASVLQIGYFWYRGKPIQVVHWLSLAIIVIFGGATLLLHDETFIKWKPTVLYWLFAAVLLVGRVVFKRNLISALLKDLTLPDSIWTRVTLSWAGFFVLMGAVNLYVASHFELDTWVNFKVWGGIGLFLLFGIAQAFALARYMPEQS